LQVFTVTEEPDTKLREIRKKKKKKRKGEKER
jgi:hypothetical protein